MKPAMLSAEQIHELLLRIKKQLPECKTIYFCEDSFCLNRQRIFDFCELSGGMFNYLIQTRSTELNEDMIPSLAKANVRHIVILYIEYIRLYKISQDPNHVFTSLTSNYSPEQW